MRSFDIPIFSENLKYYLQLSGYTVRQLADHIQTPASTVQGYLNGVTGPNPVNLGNISKTLGVPVEALIMKRQPLEPDGFLE